MGKVLFLANSDSGLYDFRRELILELSKEHEVVLCCPFGNYIDELHKLPVRLIKIEINNHGLNPLEDFKLIERYRKIFRIEKPDYLLSYTIKPNIYGGIASHGLGIKQLANITGLGIAEKDGILQKFIVLLYEFAFKNVTKVFFQNKANLAFFEKNGIAKGKYELLPGSGVNLDYFALMDYPEDDEIHFLYMSRIMKEKGFNEFVKAAEYFKKNNKNVYFDVCGPFEDDYRDIVRDLNEKGIILYHGLVKDVREVLRNIHCTIHQSSYPEGMSNVLLQSAACGRPIITTNRAGCGEVLENGVNGFLVKEHDAKDLILVMSRFLELSNEQRKQMGLAGREKVSKEFDRNIIVQKYKNAIEQ